MNAVTLENFKKEVEQIREYLKHIEYVNNVVLEANDEQIKSLPNVSNLKEHYKSFRTNIKIFEYKATIISIYGLLEKYIELWIKEYLESLSILIPQYNKINEKIRENHFNLSLKLINTITTRESAKYQHLTKEQVLAKLNTCIVDNASNQINTEAFVLSSGNLKHDKIVELFKPLNIALNAGLVKNESLNREIGLQSSQVSNEPKAILYGIINDLVERRNEIAHGSETLNILDISALVPYIQFLEKYCQAIYEILTEDFIKQESIHSFQKIEIVRDVWRNSILGFEIENYIIEVGDMLIIQTSEGNFHKKPILEIQLDDVSYPKITILEKKNIAVRVDHRITKTQVFYISNNNLPSIT